MSKIDLVASKAIRYGGRALQPGDPFQATRRDARVLEAIGKAETGKPKIPAEARRDNKGTPPNDAKQEQAGQRSSERTDARQPSRETEPDRQSDDREMTDEQKATRLAQLRERYRETARDDPDMRWGISRLEQEIAQAAGRQYYNRRDLRSHKG